VRTHDRERTNTANALTGAYIQGLSNPAIRDVSLVPRQSATDTVSLATLISQITPCIPGTVDVSSINSGMARAQSSGRVTAQGWFSFLKSVWTDVQDVFKVVADVEAVLQWGDVVKIIQLGIDAYKLYTDVTKTIIIAESLDGTTTQTFTPVPTVHHYKPPPDNCGYGTHKMCPKE
jgi:hypothetical protein